MGCVALQLVVIYVPFLNGPFGTVALSPMAWVECICLAAIVLIASELRKICLLYTSPSPRDRG